MQGTVNKKDMDLKAKKEVGRQQIVGSADVPTKERLRKYRENFGNARKT